MADQGLPVLCENNNYYTPEFKKLAEAETLFSKALVSQPDNDRIDEFKQLGFDVTLKSSKFVNYTMISEPSLQCHGKGSYAVNYSTDNNIMIQSPHVFYDKYTGEIAEQLFSTGRFYVTAMNSVSRKAKASNSDDTADLAHNDDSYLMRFSIAFAKNNKNNKIIQIHGFSRKKRKTPSGRLADVIISNGTKRASLTSKKLFQCLKKQFQEQNILHYPYDVRELGATKNIIAKRLRMMAFDGFVHLEMSYNFRKKIKTDPNKLDKVAQCLAQL